MTLTRRIELLLLAALLSAFAGSLLVHTLAARQALATQLDQRNRDTATVLALAMSQLGGDVAAMRAMAVAQFDLGSEHRLTLVDPAGRAIVDLVQPAIPSRAPGWFVDALPLAAEPGRARVGNGWREVGRLAVESETAWASDALWQAVVRTAWLMAALLLVLGGVAAGLLRAWRRPLLGTVAQAQALEQGRFVEADEPRLPELRQLTRAMNATVRRLRQLLGAQAEQVARLQRQAQLDELTGLPLRRHFVDRLQGLLDDPGVGAPSMILVRLTPLDAINARLGREATDRLLGAVAEVLQTYVDRSPGTLAGRLKGGDFALVLPIAGVGAETAAALHATLAGSPALRGSGGEIAVGAVESVGGRSAGGALAAADAALARAEADGGLWTDAGDDAVVDAAAGEGAWRQRLADALRARRVQIAEFPVLAANGSLVHLECPLRLRLDPDGEPAPAAHWLPWARRCRLLHEVDLAAVELALAAIDRDARPRAVHLGPSSVATPGFAIDLDRRLGAASAAARRLSIEMPDPARPAEWQALAQAASIARRHRVRFGVEHAGARPHQLARLRDSGVDYVKVDAAHLRGVAVDEPIRAFATSLLALIRGAGMAAMAEGVDDGVDLDALRRMGWDGMTGPAVTRGSTAAAVR